jgi:hypothetical protein
MILIITATEAKGALPCQSGISGALCQDYLHLLQVRQPEFPASELKSPIENFQSSDRSGFTSRNTRGTTGTTSTTDTSPVLLSQRKEKRAQQCL